MEIKEMWRKVVLKSGEERKQEVKVAGASKQICTDWQTA